MTAELQVSTTIFLSPGDEESFFRWLYSIGGYVRCLGQGRILTATFSLGGATKSTLQELVALFRRYGVEDTKEFRVFAASKHGEWFSSPGMYWHHAIFGDIEQAQPLIR